MKELKLQLDDSVFERLEFRIMNCAILGDKSICDELASIIVGAILKDAGVVFIGRGARSLLVPNEQKGQADV